MKNYFMISEFAKLRGININSLRYYEKLGLLIPAHIDSVTGYRYYSLDQIQDLNQIILCINLGIPLKEMKQYINEDGTLQSEELLKRGRLVALERLKDMEDNLHFIEKTLEDIETGKFYKQEQALYSRHIKGRRIIVSDFVSDPEDHKKIIAAVGDLYKIAREGRMAPILPAGQLIYTDDREQLHIRFYLEILNHTSEHPRIMPLPEGSYICLQKHISESTDLSEVIKNITPNCRNKLFIVQNVPFGQHKYQHAMSEIQVAADSL